MMSRFNPIPIFFCLWFVGHADGEVTAFEGFRIQPHHFEEQYQVHKTLRGQGPLTKGWKTGAKWYGNGFEFVCDDETTVRPTCPSYPMRAGHLMFRPTGRERFSTLSRKLDSQFADVESWSATVFNLGWQFEPDCGDVDYFLFGFSSNLNEVSLAVGTLSDWAGVLIGLKGDSKTNEIDVVARYVDADGRVAEVLICEAIRKGAHLVLVGMAPSRETEGWDVSVILDPLDIESRPRALATALVVKQFSSKKDVLSVDRLSVVNRNWHRKMFLDEIMLATDFHDLGHPAFSKLRFVLLALSGLWWTQSLTRIGMKRVFSAQRSI